MINPCNQCFISGEVLIFGTDQRHVVRGAGVYSRPDHAGAIVGSVVAVE